jgi:hypothetical protein
MRFQTSRVPAEDWRDDVADKKKPRLKIGRGIVHN